MTSLQRIFFPLILFVFFHTGGLSAKSLDIFNTLKPFPPTLPALKEQQFALGTLQDEEILHTLSQYTQAWEKTKSRDEKNLLALAAGYLHYRNQNFKSAAQFLKNKIAGNFILEDFRIHYLALVLRDQGLQELENLRSSAAINSFKDSEQLRMKIFKSYPASPFHVPRDLAEIEHLLGKAYFQASNYKTAWRVFRRSLMRHFPGNEEHKIRVNLSLALNYQSAGDLQNAADIYASLFHKSRSLEARETARNFFKIHEDRLKEGLIDLDGLIIDELVSSESKNQGREFYIPPNKKKSFYENELVEKFYESLSQRDSEKSFETGLKVLQNYPGIQETRGVIKKLNEIIVSFLRNHAVNGAIDQITALYAHKSLNSLAYSLWKDGFPGHAAVFYEKILNQYPLQIEACHKALFFLGRIAEDMGKYAKAVNYYDQLIKKYNFGQYTTSALFKIPWVHRLEKKYELARTHFNYLLDFYSSAAYRRLQASYSNPSYKVSALYWLAETQGQLGNDKERIALMKELAQNHPFEFYAILTHDESSFDLKEFLTQKSSQEIAFRKFGLGEIDRKRLSRAEKLIAVGFRDHGVHELKQLSFKKDNPAFSFYIGHLFKLGGNFQDSIRLSWKIVGAGNHDRLSRSVSENLFPKAFHVEVLETLKNYDLDPFLILSLMRQESAFNPKITSRAKAVGLMQLMPATAAEVAQSLGREVPTEERLKNPAANIRLGIDYLNHLMVSFNQNMVYALAAYNAGPTKVKQWVALRANLLPLEFIESIPYNETRDYVKKVLRNYAVYLTLYEDRKTNRFKEILSIRYNNKGAHGKLLVRP